MEQPEGKDSSVAYLHYQFGDDSHEKVALDYLDISTERMKYLLEVYFARWEREAGD